MHRGRIIRIVIALCAIGAAPATAAGSAAPAVEVTVYAAASLRDALQAIAPDCEPSNGGTIVFNFGASNDLAQQIIAANKADIFFSADEASMDKVAHEGLIDPASRRAILSNRLVVVVPEGSDLSIVSAADLAKPEVRRLALANPDAVPAGRYAKAWLESAGVWEKVRDRVAPFPDVRATLAAVEAGPAEAGVVYRTDAAITKKVRVAFEVPETAGPRISYPVAVLKDSHRLEAARAVVACFEGARAATTLERFGFIVPGSKP